MKRNTQATVLVRKLRSAGFERVERTETETVLKKGRISFRVQNDGAVYSVRRKDVKVLLMSAPRPALVRGDLGLVSAN